MSKGYVGVRGRALLLAIALAAPILQAAPASSYTGDEPALMDAPQAMDLSPRSADGLRIDVPAGLWHGADCANGAERGTRRDARCRDARAADALRPTGALPQPAAPDHGVR